MVIFTGLMYLNGRDVVGRDCYVFYYAAAVRYTLLCTVVGVVNQKNSVLISTVTRTDIFVVLLNVACSLCFTLLTFSPAEYSLL